ncbi:MAG: hypothetical protein QOD57_2016 [Actinomycetota bacterium]|nr:hypothetical protein [Actinomycetota bacterium]MDQ1504289.1 hypothetical protein [Actinomycetota bacterium]
MRRIEADFPLVPPADVARARIVDVSWLTPGVAAMTLGPVILLRRGHAGDDTLLAHELVHVRQWRELGAARFLWRYLGAYARGRATGLGHRRAYEAIPLEVEARALAGR